MELVIFSVILVLSVVAHYFLWRNSKKRYTEFMKRAEALNEKLKHLEANDEEIDKMLDKTEEGVQRMEDEIDALRSVWFAGKDNSTPDN